MVGKNHVGVIADHEVVADLHSVSPEVFHLFQKARRIDHDAVPDDRLEAWRQNTGRKQREFERPAVADDGMAGIGASVIANDDVVLIGEEIDDFAFGLVAPLQADDTSAGHCRSYPGRTSGRSGLEVDQKNARDPHGPRATKVLAPRCQRSKSSRRQTTRQGQSSAQERLV